jgi:hypothetical protein
MPDLVDREVRVGDVWQCEECATVYVVGEHQFDGKYLQQLGAREAGELLTRLSKTGS